MKMKSIVLIFIALGCGLVATIGISQVMDRNKGGGGSVKMEQILVAKGDIDIGAALDANSVQLEEWPSARIPEGAARSLDEVANKFPQARFYKGEPILQAKISDKNRNSMEDIPDGYRTSTISVNEDTVMEGISPGDRVDVLVFLKRDGLEIRQTGVYPILKNVRVFSKGSQTERTVDSKNKEIRSRTISLLVKPEQGREIALAVQMGKITLALRNPKDDPADDKDDAVPLSELLSGKSSDGDKKEGVAKDFLAEIKNAAKEPVHPVAPPTELAKGPGFSMIVQSPNEIKSYQWAEGESMPTESTLVSIGASTGAAPAPLPSPTQPNTPGGP